jgi:hypothetical protein
MATKFLEELNGGDTFQLNDVYFVLSMDYKKNGDRMCLSLKSGSSQWFTSNTIVHSTPIYTMDTENNLIAIKETRKNDTP